MNTDINSYTEKEIVSLLKLSDIESQNEETVRKRVRQIVSDIKSQTPRSIKNSTEIDELITFFKKCYINLSVSKKFNITDDIRNDLDLNDILSVTEAVPTQRAIEAVPNTGTIPEPIPPPYAVQTYPLKYPLGVVNPVAHETTSHLLIINSKFRVNTNSASYNRSQSELISSRALQSSSSDSIKSYAAGGTRKYKTTSLCPVTKPGDSGTVSDFMIELASPYRDAITMKVSSFTFDNFYYPISQYTGTNIFKITSYDYDPSSSDPRSTIANQHIEIVTLPDGGYDVNDIITSITNIFNLSVVASINAIELTYEKVKNKLIFRLLDTPPTPPPTGREFGFDLDFTTEICETIPSYIQIGRMFGYANLTYDFFTDYNYPQTTQSPEGFVPESCVNLSGTTSFFLEVNDYNNNHSRLIDYNCDTSRSFQLTNLLHRIPNMNPFGTQGYEDSSDAVLKKRTYSGPVTLSKLRIRLLDDYGIPVDLNGGTFILSLEIETLNKSTKGRTL